MRASACNFAQAGSIQWPRRSLTISSKNYSSWSLRGWLLCKIAGLEFEDSVCRWTMRARAPNCCCCRPPSSRRRSTMTACMSGTRWPSPNSWRDLPEGRHPPADRAARSHNRSVSRRNALRLRQSALGPADEHQGGIPRLQASGPAPSRTSTHHRRFSANASTNTADRSCSARSDLADAMFAPVCSRFATYHVALDSDAAGYRDHILAWASWWNGRKRPRSSRTNWKNWTSSSRRGSLGRRRVFAWICLPEQLFRPQKSRWSGCFRKPASAV